METPSIPEGSPPRPAASPEGAGTAEALRRFRDCFRTLTDNIERVVVGKRDTIELALTCMFAGGHLLVEDVPGTGKTTLARAMAASLGASCKRIQFTPDLLPSDITGVSMYRQGSGTFEFLPGPVFANIVIGDEINRASPKTQSALLEVMEEFRVTVDGAAHAVPRPFMVIGTQNPVEMSGTYPLPEAQLDRFLMRVTIGYPDRYSEIAVAAGRTGAVSLDRLPVIATARHVEEFVTALPACVSVAESVVEYAVRLVEATRESPHTRLGAGPRGSVALVRASLVRAAAHGRAHVLPEDVKELAGPVLVHRLLLTPRAELDGRTASDVVEEIRSTVGVPHPTSAGSRPGDVRAWA